MHTMAKHDHTLLPNLITKQRKVRDNFEILLSLGQVAYEDLVVGNQTLENEREKRK